MTWSCLDTLCLNRSAYISDRPFLYLLFLSLFFVFLFVVLLSFFFASPDPQTDSRWSRSRSSLPSRIPSPFSPYKQSDSASDTVIMGPGAVIEPLVVIILLFGGTWINKATGALCHRRIENEGRKSRDWSSRANSPDVLESGLRSPTVKTRLLRDRSLSPPPRTEDGWRKRRISTFGTVFEVTSPDTSVFQNRLFSRVLRNFPFLMECWYWALVYWV